MFPSQSFCSILSWITASIAPLGRTGQNSPLPPCLSAKSARSPASPPHPRARFAASRESSHPASIHPSTTNRAGQAGSGSSTRMRYPMPRAAIAVIRPSCPPPKIPIVRQAKSASLSKNQRSRVDLIFTDYLCKDLIPPLRTPRNQLLLQRSIRRREHRNRQSPAFIAPDAPIASVPTGTPFGICTMLSSESMPCSAVAGIGTPSTAPQSSPRSSPADAPLHRLPQ